MSKPHSRRQYSTQNVRTRLFLNICNDCYLEYERYLKEHQAVDFQDMINESARILREVKEMKQKLDFRYIIVDEYQDISRQRFDLVTSLHEVTAAKIIAVGDVLGIPTLFIYTLVWMARIAEELKDKAIELGIEGPHTSWWHMFGWNTFGFLLFGPAVATHRFFRTLNSEEQELNQRGAVSCPQI